MIFSVGARIGPTASNVISPCARALVQPPSTSTIANSAEHAGFVRFIDGLLSDLLNAPVVVRRGARLDLHRLHLLDVLGVHGLLATERGLERHAVFDREVVENVVLAGQKAWDFARGNERPVRSDL